MDAENTLYSLYRDAGRWHAKLAAWVGANPKKAVAVGLVLAALSAWKAVELAAWAI